MLDPGYRNRDRLLRRDSLFIGGNIVDENWRERLRVIGPGDIASGARLDRPDRPRDPDRPNAAAGPRSTRFVRGFARCGRPGGGSIVVGPKHVTRR
jgi:hypothetical protein